MFSMLNFYPKMMGYSGGGGGGGGSGGGGGGAGSGGAGGSTGGGTGGAAVGTGVGGLKTNNICGEGGRNAYNGSVFFEGEQSYLALASGAVPSFGTGDFTIEFWINQGVNASNYTVLFALTSSTPSDRLEVAIHSSTIQVYTDTGTWRDTGYAPVSGVYEHIVFQRDSSGNTLKMYANGVEKWSVSNTRDYDEAWTTQIGSYASSSYGYFEGYISNFRICIGHTVYSSNNFTPPTSPLTAHFTNSSDRTVLLCCQNSDNPLEENSVSISGESIPQTIIGYGRFPSEPYDANGEGPELVTSTGVWTLEKGGGGATDFSVTNNGQTLTGTTVTSGYIRAIFTGLNASSRYRVKATVVAGSNNNIGIQDEHGYQVATDGTAGTALQVGPTYVFEFSGTTTVRITGSAWNVQYIFDDVSIKQIPSPDAPKVIPPFGTDNGVTFDGAIAMNSSAYMYFPTGRTEERGRGRAIFGGGQSTSYTSAIHVFNIQSQGNTVEVGQLSQSNWGLGACGSSTRGLFGGGRTAPGGSGNYLNTIEFVTIANAGNSSDFGDLTRAASYINALGNETRGIWGGGYNVDTKPATNVGSNTIDYVTIASTGNAADFGDLVRQSGSSDTTFSKFTTASSTRGLFAGGYGAPSGQIDEITYITIATTGNTTYFGDLTATNAFGGSGASSSTRGIVTVGGSPGPHNRIEFVTIASTGNATDFGDLSLARRYAQGVSNKTRAVFITGYTGADTNFIDFVNIATTGNATDFGDRDREDNYGNGATSDSHGGLS